MKKGKVCRFIANKIDRLKIRVYDLLVPGWTSRPMITFVRKNFNYPLTGVEIGVEEGFNAKNILMVLDMKVLYLIDPKPRYYNYLSRYDDRIEPLELLSENAVKYIPEGLDFVYIDGDHSYKGVKSDIDLYYPKVRTGGVIGGHDFGITFLGVIDAVLDFVRDNDLKLYVEHADWWVVKKGKGDENGS